MMLRSLAVLLCALMMQPQLTACCEEVLQVPCPEKPQCKCMHPMYDSSTVLCCHIYSTYQLKESLNCPGLDYTEVTRIHIRNMSLDTLDAGLWVWKNLESLKISDSKVDKLKGQFRGELGCINVSAIGLTDVDPKAFLNLHNLHTLDLSNNKLTNVPHVSPSDTSTGNITIDISGNSPIWCHSVIDLMDGLQNSSSHINFLNDNSTFCLSSRSFNWFNSTEMVPLVQVVMLKRLELKCPRGAKYKCHCSPYRVDILPGQFPTYNAKVDCSGQHLSKLPLHLPPNTKLLNVTNNNITSLDILSIEETYRDIREFYADNNQIDSITVLEGSYFIDHFTMLSLRGNNLTSIPTYILSNAFDRNRLVQNIKLGGNRINCDCNTAQVLKMWLMTNKAYIPDYEEVLCSGDFEKVIFLDQNKVCVYKKEWTDYIYYIIGGEVFLLACIISKLIYDYYIFKSKGYLPWPASKMPKLPCEWLFES